MRPRKIALRVLLAGPLAFLILALPVPAPSRGQEKKPEKQERKAEKKRGEEKKARRKEEPKPDPVYDLRIRGKLEGPAKSNADFYELSYNVIEGKKGVKKKVWVKIDSATQLRRDRPAAITEYKEGDMLQIFGKPVEREAGNQGGIAAGPPLRLIQASRLLIGGKDVVVNAAYSDPKDKGFDWCHVKVEKPGLSMTVNYEENSYRVALDKPSALMMREDGDLKRDVRKGALVYLEANAVSEKPEGEKAEFDAFHAENLIVMEPKLLRWYEALFKPSKGAAD